MMKKLLVLSLVLVMASLASATVTLVPEKIDLQPSDVITIDIITADNQLANLGVFVGVVVEGPGTISLGNAQNLFNPGALDTLPGEVAGAFGFSSAIFADLAKPEYGTVIPNGPVVNDLLFHCDGPGDVIIRIINPDSGAVLSEVMIHQAVPEPATMALLGLGGLFLRRKK